MKKFLVTLLLICSVVSLFANATKETTAVASTATVSQEEIEYFHQ